MKLPLIILLVMSGIGIVRADSLIVGVESTEQFPIYSSADGQYNGYARELLDGFAAKHGHTITYEIVPILRLYNDFFQRKSVDFKFPDNPNWQLDMRKGFKVSYSKPALSVVEGLWVLPANQDKGLLSGIRTLAAMRGFTPWPYMDGIKRGYVKYIEVNEFENLINMIEKDRVDGVYVNVTVMKYYLSKVRMQPDLLVFDEKLPHVRADFHLSSIKRADIVAQFDDYLATEKRAVARLKAKYLIME